MTTDHKTASIDESKDDGGMSSPMLYSHNGSRMYVTKNEASALRKKQATELSNVSEFICIQWATHHLRNETKTPPGLPHLVEPPSDYLLVEKLLYQTSISSNVPVGELCNVSPCLSSWTLWSSFCVQA